VIQQGQVFKLKARGADARPLWAYRYRLDGRASARRQVGGFASRAEAEEALRKALARMRPRRSGHSSRGSRSRPSRLSSGRGTGRW
jgi:hypothetical protein